MSLRPQIILYNPESGSGHHDGWLVMFTSILLSRGYTVYCLTPDTEALLLGLRQRGMEQHPNLAMLPALVPHHVPVPEPTPLRHFTECLKNRLRRLSNTYVNRLENSRITPEMPISRRCKMRLAQLLVPPSYALFKAIRRSMRFLTTANCFSPEEWGQQMEKALYAMLPGRYFLFNMRIDLYNTDQASWKGFSRNCQIPWAALHIAPDPEQRAAYYTLSAFRGMCFLDEDLCRTYSEILPEKCFICLPDVADASLPAVLPPAAQAIAGRAAGRKIIFMGGAIGSHKNITQWRELIRLADPRRFFFAQIGMIYNKICFQADQNILRDLAVSPPENFFMLDEYLADERNFNACIAASDVIFAVYKDFSNSSNMLGKAAAFGKPILVSDRYLMGERVRHYGLGAAVPEDDAGTILAALERLIQTPPVQESFAAYNAAHNEEAMGRALGQFIDACLKQHE